MDQRKEVILVDTENIEIDDYAVSHEHINKHSCTQVVLLGDECPSNFLHFSLEVRFM